MLRFGLLPNLCKLILANYLLDIWYLEKERIKKDRLLFYLFFG